MDAFLQLQAGYALANMGERGYADSGRAGHRMGTYDFMHPYLPDPEGAIRTCHFRGGVGFVLDNRTGNGRVKNKVGFLGAHI